MLFPSRASRLAVGSLFCPAGRARHKALMTLTASRKSHWLRRWQNIKRYLKNDSNRKLGLDIRYSASNVHSKHKTLGGQCHIEVPPCGTSLRRSASIWIVRMWLMFGVPPETSACSLSIPSFVSVAPDQRKSPLFRSIRGTDATSASDDQ
jgi:hypothetical protein